MNISVAIPDDFARHIGADRGKIDRRVLEALALDEFRQERLTRPELQRLLGFATRGELDVFLLDHGVAGYYEEKDLEQDRADLRRLGL